LQNPSFTQLYTIGNTDLLFVILSNKTELLLNLYRSSGKKEYVDACIATGMLMDSAITLARHEQTDEKSKLYWRNNTRSFFKNILEACYLSGNMGKAFYFMEKSRAVLLNDRLNELGASLHLPEKEMRVEQYFQVRLLEQKMRLINIGN